MECSPAAVESPSHEAPCQRADAWSQWVGKRGGEGKGNTTHLGEKALRGSWTEVVTQRSPPPPSCRPLPPPPPCGRRLGVFFAAGEAREKMSRDPATDQLKTQAAKASASTLTTSNGNPVDSLTASMTAGPRGPITLQDFALIDHIAHFDRERIPERVVHAKGAGAFGYEHLPPRSLARQTNIGWRGRRKRRLHRPRGGCMSACLRP